MFAPSLWFIPPSLQIFFFKEVHFDLLPIKIYDSSFNQK